MKPLWLTRLFHPGAARLLLYADGALPPGRSARVRAHLEVCPRCADELRLAKESLEWLRSLRGPVPANALEAVRARLLEEIRAAQPGQAAGELTRRCLGSRSIAELGARLRRTSGSPSSLPDLAAPMFEAFLGKKTLPAGSGRS
jgi:anti-sigma factor RsiW